MHATPLALLMSGSLLAASAVAASTPLATGAQTPERGAEQERPARAAPAAERNLVRASKLEGAEVHTELAGDATEALGEIAAFRVALDTGAVTHAVVSSGGLAGVGDERRALPFQRLRWAAEDGRFVASMTRGEFERLPVIDDDTEDAGARERAAREGAQRGDAGTEAAAMLRRPARVLSTERIRGQVVRLSDSPQRAAGTDGDDEAAEWGEIAGFAIATDGREVAYAVVETGGLAGVGATEHPVPWTAFRMELVHEEAGSAPERGAERVAKPSSEQSEPELRVTLPMTKSQLADAPTLDADAGHSFSDAQFLREVDVFYGVEPTQGERGDRMRGERDAPQRERG